METGSEKILFEAADGIGVLTFNNPVRRNAMSLEMCEAAARVVEHCSGSPEIKVLVLKGAGGKSFVSGADIAEFDKQRANADQAEHYSKISSQARAAMLAFEKPLIAAIQGYCIGGGMSLALAADMRFATTESQFGIPAARLGLAYGFETTRRLTDLVGPAQAKQILFTGSRMSAAEARRIGLVNDVFTAEEFELEVHKIAATICENAPLTVATSKFSVDKATEQYSEADLDKLAEMVRVCFDSEDYREGRTAFIEKRSPRFSGQ